MESQSFSVYNNSNLKNILRSNNLSTQRVLTQNMNTQVNLENKYVKMIEEMNLLNKTRKLNLDLVCEKTLYDLMHLQTKFGLSINDDKLDELIQSSENVNDTIEMFYTKNYTIAPLLYRLIISMCCPDEIDGVSLDFQNQKCIILNYTKIFNKTNFEKEFLFPFFKEKVLPLLTDSNEDKSLKEFFEKVYKNIYILNYTNLVELLFKLHNLPNTINKVKDVSLVVIDSPNLLLNQSIKLEHEQNVNHNLDESNSHHVSNNNKTTITFNKKKRKSLKNEEKNLFTLCHKILGNIQKEFNFNIIFTIYDFERIENLNFLKFKLSYDETFIEKNRNFYKITLSEENNKIYFIFQLKDFHDRYKIYSLEPTSNYINFDCSITGYLIYMGDDHYKFKAFLKKTKIDKIVQLKEVDLYYQKPPNKK